MSEMSGIKSITVIGRRWFSQYFGNTYFTAEVIVNGERVITCEEAYGYGDFYLQRAFERLDESGLLPVKRIRHDNGSREAPWRYCQRVGIKLHHVVADVARKKDLRI